MTNIEIIKSKIKEDCASAGVFEIDGQTVLRLPAHEPILRLARANFMTVFLHPILMRSCFCEERLNFEPAELPVQFKPRFEFRAGVETLAAKIGATEIWFNPREKRATALLKNFCKHGDMPISFDWNLHPATP